jgi:hypothetical protein
MRDERDDDLRDRTLDNREEQVGPEEVSKGRDVHDVTRESESRGRDVITDAEELDTESSGRTVVDRSHIAEARGVDVIDQGPATPDDEPRQP